MWKKSTDGFLWRGKVAAKGLLELGKQTRGKKKKKEIGQIASDLPVKRARRAAACGDTWGSGALGRQRLMVWQLPP